MQNRYLTSEEIDLLLSSATSDDDTPEAETPMVSAICATSVEKEQTGDAIASLLELHEKLAVAFERALRQQLNGAINVRSKGVLHETYSQFVFGRPIPTCFVLIDAAPLDATFLLDISPSIVFPLLDILLGSAEPGPPAQRPLTEIEARLLRRLLPTFLDAYRDQWAHILSLDLRIDRIEHNPQPLRIYPGSEPVVFARFQVCASAAFGHFDLCVPTKAIQQMASRLSAA